MSLPLDLPRRDRRSRDRRPVVVAVLVAFCCTLTVMLPVLIAVQNSSRKVSKDLVAELRQVGRTAFISSCDRGNLASALQLGVAEAIQARPQARRVLGPEVFRRQQLARDIYGVRDCPATFDDKRVVLVSPAVEHVFVKLVLDGERPAIRDGKVTRLP